MVQSQPVRFLLVGTAGYACSLLVFRVLLSLGVPYGAGSVAAYLASNALMYLGNRFFTFRAGWTGFWSGYTRYVAVGLVIAASNTAVLFGLVDLAGIAPFTGAALSLLLVTPVAFVLNKRWTFRSATGTPAQAGSQTDRILKLPSPGSS